MKTTTKKKPKSKQTPEKIFLDSIFLEGLAMPYGVSDSALGDYAGAMDLVLEMYDQPTKAKRIALAKKALALSPYVIDARILLIDEAMKSPDEQIAACLEAIKLGRKFIGKQALKEFHGELWGYMDARPTLRACHRLALLYADAGNLQKAIETYQQILDMNVNDNQGIRHELLPLLIRTQQWDEAAALYKTYKGEYAAFWHYLGALVDFAQGAAPAKIEKKIGKAHVMNGHFLPYMRKEKPPPKKSYPGYYSPGDITEALTFIDDVYESWESVDGALSWLRQSPAVTALAAQKPASAATARRKKRA